MVALIVLIIFYKIGDAFALKFFTAFMINVGFTKTEIGVVVKAVLTTGSILGALLGGIWMIKLGLRRAMLLFAIVQALTNLGYLLLYAIGKNYAVMVGAVALDALASGMGNIASVALMMALCDKRFSAFQYALLSMMALLPRYTLGVPGRLHRRSRGLGRLLLDQLRARDTGNRAGLDHAQAHRSAGCTPERNSRTGMREIDTARVLCSLAELDETGSRGFAVGEGDWPLRGFVVEDRGRASPLT